MTCVKQHWGIGHRDTLTHLPLQLPAGNLPPPAVEQVRHGRQHSESCVKQIGMRESCTMCMGLWLQNDSIEQSWSFTNCQRACMCNERSRAFQT